MDPASEGLQPRLELEVIYRSLFLVKRELLDLLAMLPESTEQLETMLVEEALHILSGFGTTIRDGLTSILLKLETFGLVGHEVVGGETGDDSPVWWLTSVGRMCRDTAE